MAKKDPFAEDHETGDEKVADKAAAERFKERVSEKREAASNEEAIEVDVERAEEELSDLPERTERTRQEKKQNRYREMQEERDAAKRDREEMKQRLAQMEQMLQQRQAPPPQAPPPDKESPLKTKLAKLYAEQKMLYRDFAARQGQMTPAELESFDQKVFDIQAEMMQTSTAMELERQGIRQIDDGEVRAQILQEQMMREHGDVLSNPNMKAHCEGTYMQLRARGKPDDWSTLAEAAEITRRTFHLPSKTPRQPSESYKRKLTSIPRGAGSGGSESAPTTVTMTGHDKAMANAMYKHIPNESERYKRWAAGPGKRLAEKRHNG